MTAGSAQLHSYRTRNDPPGAAETARSADPVAAEIIRRALDSAAKQMKDTTIRTSFSPIIYESLDFAVVLYDRHVRLLAQAPTQPIFMGNMSFAIESAVRAVGGAEVLEPGDILIYNVPYGSGSHAQDCSIVMPVFLPSGELVGYAANKAHWLDIGALAPYCTNTTDVYQEGMVIPGLKLYRAGRLDEGIFRFILANSRFERAVEGDLNAQIASCHVGSRELVRIIERFGTDTFGRCVERIFDHGERLVRDFIRQVPDGTYRATCHMDDNGVDDTPIEFEVVVVIDGSSARFDFSEAPDAQPSPINCPQPTTVCASRVILAMLAGKAHETPNEGSFRPPEVITRPGSMFHPVEPQPCFLYAWPAFAAMEGISEAFAQATGGAIPSGSAGDIMGYIVYGMPSQNTESFYFGGPLPVGHGGSPDRDGSTLYHVSVAHAQLQSPELQEAKSPVLFEKWEFTPDSGGVGRFRGGDGWEMHIRMLADAAVISVVERTREPSWAQKGGLSGVPNRLEVDFPDGHTETLRKVTDLHVPSGGRLRFRCGGGGGYGDPAERAPAAVRNDLIDGLVTANHARHFYPEAWEAIEATDRPE